MLRIKYEIRLVGIIYITISLLTLLCVMVTTATLGDCLIGLLYLWICFCFFWLGAVCKVGHGEVRLIKSYNVRALLKEKEFLISFLCMLGSIITAYYYTGQTPISCINAIRSGQSLYNLYQHYFALNSLSLLTVSKIPIVLLNIIIEFVLVYSYIWVFFLEKKMTIRKIVLIFAVSLSKMYFGFCRGTNFEMFETVFLLMYCLWMSFVSENTRKHFMRLFFLLILFVVAVVCFLKVIEMRGNVGTFVKVSGGIYTDEDSSIVKMFPILSKIIAFMSEYFAFGIFVIAYFYNQYFTSTAQTFFWGIVPGGYGIVGESVISAMYADSVFLHGANWNPDLMRMIDFGGILLGPFVFYLCGLFLHYLNRNVEKNKDDVFSCMLKFYLVFQMFSFPIGNFIWIGSSTRFCIVLILLLMVVRPKSLGRL